MVFFEREILPILFLDQLIDAGGLAVEEIGDRLLGGEVRNRDLEIRGDRSA